MSEEQNGSTAGTPSPERLGSALTADMLTLEDWEDMFATHNKIAKEMESLRKRILKRSSTRRD